MVQPLQTMTVLIISRLWRFAKEVHATLGGMVEREPHLYLRRMALPITLVVALMATAALTRSAIGESHAGTRITNVSVEHRGDDSSVIAVSFDGPIKGHRWFHMDGGEPRAVVRIGGIVEAFRPYEVAVEDGRVRRVRIGHHPEYDPPEEFLVFDLVDNRVAITQVVKEDQRLIVVLKWVGDSDPSRLPAPSAPTPVQPSARTAPATPIPATTPTPVPTVTPTPTPTVMPTPMPTAPPARPIPVPPTAAPTSTASPEPQRAAPTTIPTTPPPITPDRRATAIPGRSRGFSGPVLTELVISHRKDGSALVRISADGPIEGKDVRYFGVRNAPPRHLLVITGVGLPGEGALLPVRDGLLCEIEVAFKEDDGQARIELTFYLASSEVIPARAAVKGVNAVVHLLPPADPQNPLGCEVESPMRSRSWRFTATGPPREAPDSFR